MELRASLGRWILRIFALVALIFWSGSIYCRGARERPGDPDLGLRSR